MKYLVSYTEIQIRELRVEADSPEEAEAKVLDGDVDYDESSQVDATVSGVNSVEEVE